MAPTFVCPDWWVWSLILILAGAANVQGDCSPNSRCGNLTISEPFGIVPDEAAENNCGSLGFQVTCQNNTPYLGYYRHDNNKDYYQLQILNIFYGNGSLLVADMQKFGDLANTNHRDCGYKFPTANTSSKIALPFSISPINQNLVLYNCTTPPPPPAAAAEGIVERRCGNSTIIARVGDKLGNSSSYFVQGCTATVVPVRAGYGEASSSNYVQLISDGFLLTWPLQRGKFILEATKIG